MRRIYLLLIMCGLFCLFSYAFAEEPPDIIMPVLTGEPQLAAAVTPAPLPGTSMLADDGILHLVNRDKRITKAYVPADLVTPRTATRKKSLQENILMRTEAARALEGMFAAAKEEGNHILYAASGYRSYGIQQILFNQKVQTVGNRDKAQKTVAPAGTSEHQLGLAMDLQAPSQLNLNRSFGDTDEGKWVANNAHRFGFIVRYKREWSQVTGYLYEPWHVRYVGVAHAKALFALDIPLETYAAQLEKLPEYVLRGATDRLLVGLLTPLLADETAAIPIALLNAEPENQAQALRSATLPFLAAGTSYEAVLWAIYPTPKPTAGPRVENDVETSVFTSERQKDGLSD
jgi:D-alanyl-D-alanine carboxypeptidase